VQLVDFALDHASLLVVHQELAQCQVRSQLLLLDHCHCDPSSYEVLEAYLSDFGPVLLALGPSILLQIAHHGNQDDVLLHDHAPEVEHSHRSRALCPDQPPVIEAERTVDVASINVRVVNALLLSRSRGSRHKSDTRAVERPDVDVPVLRHVFAVVHHKVYMRLSKCQSVKFIEFIAEALLCALYSLRNPLRDGHCIFEVADGWRSLLQKLIGDIGLLVVLVWPG